MKYLALSLALAAASMVVQAQNNNRNGGNNNNNNGGNNNNNNNNNGGNNNNNGGGGDPQTSLTLDPSVICTACTDNGQNPPVDQQTASLTSSNNFINFCNGKTLTNGQQLVQGSCNGVVIGEIIPSSNMPAAKISFPQNFGTFQANQQFTATINIKNMITGNFVNAQTNYYGAPQQLQGNNVIGHSHLTVQKVDSLQSTQPLDPEVFAFFKGINTAANNGVLSVDVTDGLPEGVYRFCTMNTNANHTPVMVAIAQHGSLDDCIYATAVTGNGNNGQNNGQNGQNNGQNGQNNGQNNQNNGQNNGQQNNGQQNNGQQNNGQQNNGQQNNGQQNNGQQNNGQQNNGQQNNGQQNNGQQNNGQQNNGNNGGGGRRFRGQNGGRSRSGGRRSRGRRPQ